MLGLTTTRRLRAELAAAKAETNRQRERAEWLDKQATRWRGTATTSARQFAEADAANRRLEGRVNELGRRLTALTESDPEYAADLEARLDRALTACARYLDALWKQGRRADQLQQRLDDAVGLGRGRIVDSCQWQPGYKKPKADAS